MFDKVLDGQHQRWRVHLETVLEHKLYLRHHRGYLVPSDLLPRHPPEHIDLVHPLTEKPHYFLLVVLDQHHHVEPVIPQEASREDEARGGGGMGEGLLLGDKGVLGVEGAVVPGDSGEEVALDVLEELAFFVGGV